MSKKFKSYNKITDYIEDVDPDLFDIIENLCLEPLFIPRKDKGITLLLPTDKNYRNKIKELTFSDNIDDVDTAAKMISSIIITDTLKSPGDFMEKRDDIPNTLGQRIEIEGVRGRTIYLKNNVEIKVDERFKDSSKGNRLAVWIMSNGGPPIDGPKASHKYTKKKQSKEKEQPEINQNKNNIRLQISNSVENNYITNKLSNNIDNDIYLETVLSLINFMLKNEYCKELLINKILPLFSFDKTDFYLIFEPYKSVGPYLVSDRIINDWYHSKKNYNIKNIVDNINNLLDNSKDVKALMYSNIQGALNTINEKRNKLLKSRVAPQNITIYIEKVYEELFKSNIIPKELMEHYGSHTYKLYEDEFRFVIYQMFNRLENEPIFDRRKFDNIIDIIYGYTSGPTLQPLLFKKPKTSQLPPTEKVAEIKIFINSSTFFYIPISFKSMENYPHEDTIYKPNPLGMSSIYNISKVLQNNYKRYVELYPTPIKKKEVDYKSFLKKLKDDGKLDEYLKDL